MSPELIALRDEAMAVSCASWAIQKRWGLSKGREMVGACPKCRDGTDRFSINANKDVFNCRHCGIAGQGVIKLVMLVDEVGFVEACQRITGRTLTDPVDEQRLEDMRQATARNEANKAADEARYRAQARQEGHDVWVSGWSPTREGVLTYLDKRAITVPAGIDPSELRLREYDALPWVERVKGDTGHMINRVVHRGLAMLAMFTMPARLTAPGDPLGRFGGVHRTWLDLGQPKGRLVLPPTDAGKPRPTKKMLGLKQGGAMMLFTPMDANGRPTARRIVMGEGIETTLTPFAHAFEPDTAYWAAGDVGNMSGKALYDGGKRIEDLPDMAELDCFLPPDWCEELVFLGEADEPGKHQREKCIRGLRRAKALRDAARLDRPELPGLSIKYVPVPAGSDDVNAIAMAEAQEVDRDGETT